MCGVLVWDNISVRAASQLILGARGDISYRCRTWWVPGMVDQSPCLGLDLFFISPDYSFLPPTLFNTVYEVTLKLLYHLPEVFEKLTGCWAWKHCLMLLLFCSWCKNLADVDSTFCPVLKHQGLGLLDAFSLLNICLIFKITCSHVCLLNRLVTSQFTHLSVNIREFTLCSGLDFSLAALKMLLLLQYKFLDFQPPFPLSCDTSFPFFFLQEKKWSLFPMSVPYGDLNCIQSRSFWGHFYGEWNLWQRDRRKGLGQWFL